MDQKTNPVRTRRFRGRGTVAILALLLVTSASLRIAMSATEVLAEAKAAFDTTSDEPSEPAASSDLSDAYFARLLKDFQKREEALRKKELDLEKRQIALEATETRVKAQLEQMKVAEQNLRDTLALASTAAEDDLARLTAVYENMKPKTAAALFEEMAPDFAAGFVARMRPDAAAAILAGMTPQAAYSISTILAGRNADVPSE